MNPLSFSLLADGEPEVLEDIFEARSPHMIVTTDYDVHGKRKPIAAVLKLTQNTSAVCSNPDPATIIIVSMASYFLFSLEFPPAYESTLRLFEKSIHGNLSLPTSRKRAKVEYRDFVKKFKQ